MQSFHVIIFLFDIGKCRLGGGCWGLRLLGQLGTRSLVSTIRMLNCSVSCKLQKGKVFLLKEMYFFDASILCRRDFLGGYNFDFLGASGNAEVQDPIYGSSEIWAKHQRNLWDHYKTRIVDRNRGACRGYYDREEPGSVEEYGERYSCFYGPNNEHHIIFLGWFQGSNQSNVEEARHEIARSARFIDREFSSSRKKVQNTKWRYCVQHMTTSKLSGGGGPDHDNMRNSAITDTCRKHGALIISGHHHIYSRTKLLSSVGGRNGREDVVSHSNQREIRPGRTMSLTVGMGGYGGRCNGKFANAPWMEQCITGGQFRGAVIAEFDDDDPRRAIFRYKNSMADDEILDEWRLFSRLAAPPTPPPTSPPTLRPRLGECKGDCDDDGDCQSGLYCYQRDPYEPIPGCDGVGESDGSRTDYCTYDGTRIDES